MEKVITQHGDEPDKELGSRVPVNNTGNGKSNNMQDGDNGSYTGIMTNIQFSINEDRIVWRYQELMESSSIEG